MNVVPFNKYDTMITGNKGYDVFTRAMKFYKSKLDRFMSIKNANGDVILNLKIDLTRAKPLFQTPVEVIKEKVMVDIPIVKAKYETLNYSFGCVIPNNFMSMEDPNFNDKGDLSNPEYISYVSDINTEISSELSKLSATGNDSRYVELFSFTNPLTQSDYSVFLDRVFGDLFLICGLGLLLDSNIEPNSNKVLVVQGLKIGEGSPQDFNKPVYDVIATQNDELFKIEGAITDSGDFQDTDVYCKAVTFTRDLPGNIANTNYPVFYDKLMHVNGTEIQLARQDTIPIIWINFGTASNFLDPRTPNISNKLPNFLIYNQGPNLYRFVYNGTKHKDTTQFGIAVPIY